MSRHRVRDMPFFATASWSALSLSDCYGGGRESAMTFASPVIKASNLNKSLLEDLGRQLHERANQLENGDDRPKGRPPQ
jgi:hypothetical protein